MPGIAKMWTKIYLGAMSTINKFKEELLWKKQINDIYIGTGFYKNEATYEDLKITLFEMF